MSTLRGPFRTFIANLPGVAGIIPLKDISWGKADASTAAQHIVLERVANAPERHMGGTSALTSSTFEVRVYDSQNGMMGMETIGEAIRKGMDGFRGDMAGAIVESVTLEDEDDDTERDADGRELPIHSLNQTWLIWHRHEAATYQEA